MKLLNKNRRINNSGMTLIEIVVVIVILGLIAGIVGQKVFKQTVKARINTAKSQIANIKGAVELYRLDVGDLPSTQHGLKALITNPGMEGWDGPYIDDTEIPKDPWNNPYAYKAPGTNRDFDITSYGKDKAPGGSDENADITN